MEQLEIIHDLLEDSEDQDVYKSDLIRKILLIAFLEYIVYIGIIQITFIASIGLLYMQTNTPYYCCIFLSFVFQIYFEFQSNIKNVSLRQNLNYIFGGISIISNCFSNYYLLSSVCYGSLEPEATQLIGAQKYLTFAQILVVLYMIKFYANIIDTNFQDHFIWIVPIVVPCLLQALTTIFTDQGFNLFATFFVIWIFILMAITIKQMKHDQDSPDQIFVNSCKLLGIMFQIFPFLIKFPSQKNQKITAEKLGKSSDEIDQLIHLRNVSINFFIISLFVIIQWIFIFTCVESCLELDSQRQVCKNECFENDLLYFGADGTTLLFTALFWISVGLSFIAYILMLFLYNRVNYFIQYLVTVGQIVFFFFTFFGISEYVLYFIDGFMGYLVFSQIFCSIAGIPIGLLIYTFNINDLNYSKVSAILYMLLCPICVWLVYIYEYALYQPAIIGDTFGYLMIYVVYAIWISFELQWQINSNFFPILKCNDDYLGLILVLEPNYSIITRLIMIFKKE